jgi:hypothetical protein
MRAENANRDANRLVRGADSDRAFGNSRFVPKHAEIVQQPHAAIAIERLYSRKLTMERVIRAS